MSFEFKSNWRFLCNKVIKRIIKTYNNRNTDVSAPESKHSHSGRTQSFYGFVGKATHFYLI